MLTIFDVLKSIYIGLNLGVTMFYPFVIGDDWFWDRKYTIKQLICNILFPLTIIMYPLGYIIEKLIYFMSKINSNKVLFKK